MKDENKPIRMRMSALDAITLGICFGIGLFLCLLVAGCACFLTYY